MQLKFSRFDFKEFNLKKFKILFVSEGKFSLISVNFSPHEYSVLSSEIFQISHCSIIMDILSIYITNESGSNIDL